MDRLTHSALAAMHMTSRRQAIIAGNMANASTAGFRADRWDADARYISAGPHGGLSARAAPVGGIAATDLSAGTVTATARPLDIAMNGDALLAVQAGDGGEGYTRRGDLRLSATGLLETGDGWLVLGEGGPLSLPPHDGLRIAPSGEIFIRPAGSAADAAEVSAGRLRLASATGSTLAKDLDGLLRVPGGGVLPADPAATVTPGAIEGANVNMSEALVEMIDAARAYETHVRMISTARELDEGGTRLMRLDG